MSDGAVGPLRHDSHDKMKPLSPVTSAHHLNLSPSPSPSISSFPLSLRHLLWSNTAPYSSISHCRLCCQTSAGFWSAWKHKTQTQHAASEEL